MGNVLVLLFWCYQFDSTAIVLVLSYQQHGQYFRISGSGALALFPYH